LPWRALCTPLEASGTPIWTRDGRRETEALQEALEPVLAHLHRLQRLETLRARERILEKPVLTGEEWHRANARGERVKSIEHIIGGGAVGPQGHQLSGLLGLVSAFRDVFAEPAPHAEVELEPEDPPAVRAQKENRGLLPRTVRMPF
jgi:hypothetical protein